MLPAILSFLHLHPIRSPTVLLLASAPVADPLAALGPLGTLRSADGTRTNQTRVAPSARSSHRMVSLGGDQVLVCGGDDAGGLSGETWLATGFYSGIWYRTYLPLVAK